MPSDTNPSLTMTVAELAKALQVSPRTIARLRAQGALPRPVKIGKAIRWPREEIAAWLAAGAPDLVTWQANGRWSTKKGIG